jgi:predicted MFS family arabinose efflux permease
MTSLNGKYGARWCFRVLGFMSFVIFIGASLSFKQKSKKGEKTKKFKEIVDFSVLKNKNLLIWCIADNVIEAGYYVPYLFLPGKLRQGKKRGNTSVLIVYVLNEC